MARAILYLDGTGAVSGAEVSLLTLARHLHRQRYTPQVVLPWDGEFAARLRAHDVPVHVMDVRPLTLIHLNPLRIAASALRTLPFTLSLTRFIRKHGIDLVHVNSYRIGIPCSLAARLTGVPVVWHIRDIATSRLKRRAVAFLVHALADRAIAISHAVASQLRPDSDRTVVIYNGVDADAFAEAEGRARVRQELGLDPDTPLIGNVGQFVPWKGQDLLIEAMAQVTGAVPEARLLLVGYQVPAVWEQPGDGTAYEARLQRLAQERGLEDRVLFCGFRRDVAAVMKALDLYAHAAVHPEPFGRVLVEAMAAGRAVVAPAAGGAPEIVEPEETGLLFPPGDAEALAETIITLLRDPTRRVTMGQRGAQVARQKFSVQKHVAGVERVYNQLLNTER